MLLAVLLAWATPSYSITPAEQFRFSADTVISNATRPDVVPGMVVASPSRQDPDYYFDWVRDTALTMRVLVEYQNVFPTSKVKNLLTTWIEAELKRQNAPTLSGLGEPKFNIDGSSYQGPWGRPQNDGPALRALAMIRYARILLSRGEEAYVLAKLFNPVLPANTAIKKDLEYTAHHWREPSFDLWEEEKGMHFYTLLAQHTALQEGALLARQLADDGAARFYAQESVAIGVKLQAEFTSTKVGLLVSKNVVSDLGYKTSGLDVAPLLALIHTYPYQQLFTSKNIHVKKYIETLISRFSALYSLNRSGAGIAIGRYPEDRYDGYATTGKGNPWFLSTLALAEYYCTVNPTADESQTMAKAQYARLVAHRDPVGHLSEQFNQDSGYMQGARDLTWSHASVVSFMMRCGWMKR